MSVTNPWRKLSSRLIYENPWIRVREDQVIAPSGLHGIYGVVEARNAVGVVALGAHNELYLVGQYRYPTDCYSWEIPEGAAENGETPLQAAKRELREETGLTATSWEPLGGEVHLSNCFTAERAHIFLARGLTQGETDLDPTEQIVKKSVGLKEALRMAMSGEISDGMSLIAIHRAAAVVGV
jgi:ADP-ribose pyrophosphatase YjhB (NUDIX family)